MGKRSKYGEETVFLNVRVPKSRKDEISNRFYVLLNEYVVGGLMNPSLVRSEIIESRVEQNSVENNDNILEQKLSLDEVYDCVEVRQGVPDVEYRVYIDSRKDCAFTDKNDFDVYYGYLDLKYYKFANKKEFDKFLKDYLIK